MSKSYPLVAGAVLIAFGVLLPMAFHLVGALGPVFLPMHIPVMVSGFYLGPYYGLWVGLLTPVLSSLLTGMPPLLPMMPLMAVELSVYGLVCGYLYRRRGVGIWAALIAAMAAGRLAAAIAAYGLVALFAFKIAPVAFLTGAVLTGLPGITLQLMLVPPIVRRLRIISGNK